MSNSVGHVAWLTVPEEDLLLCVVCSDESSLLDSKASISHGQKSPSGTRY